jgi:ABC-type Fe3+ transport system permease subunit
LFDRPKSTVGCSTSGRRRRRRRRISRRRRRRRSRRRRRRRRIIIIVVIIIIILVVSTVSCSICYLFVREHNGICDFPLLEVHNRQTVSLTNARSGLILNRSTQEAGDDGLSNEVPPVTGISVLRS